jgi:hypothetical protein
VTGGQRVQRWTWRVLLVVAATAGVAVAALPEPRRPVLVAAAVAVAVALAAAVTGSRLVGTLTLGVVTATVLLASATDSSGRPTQVVVAGAIVLVLLTALEKAERVEPDGREAVTVVRAGAVERLGAPVLAVAASALVAVTAAQHVVPSVRLVLLGLAGSVAALVVAIRTHRN